jgi:hypothetical protein
VFGTATSSDVTSLHTVINELQLNQKDIVHSMANVVVKSHNKFQEVTRDILQLNVTIYHQSKIYMAIRQLEFSLLQLTQQLNELVNVIQYTLSGKLPINVLNPSTLHNILTNVSLHLPEGYELVAGTRAKNIYLYYELVEAMVVGNVYRVQIVLHIPLKTTNHFFELYKIVALPAQISDRKFAQHFLDYTYFGIDNIQRNYILFMETEMRSCTKGSVTVCPANSAIYSAQEITCESSLYLQKTDSYSLCRRRLILDYKTPMLQRHGTAWVYYLPERQHVAFCCWKNGTWTSHTEALMGSGVIYNTSGCAITATGFQTLPDLQGDFQVTPDAPHLYVPEKVTIVADHEQQLLEEVITPPDAKRLDEVISKLNLPHQIADIGSLFHVHATSINRQQRTHWYLTIMAVLCAFTSVGFLSYSSYTVITYYRNRIRKSNPDAPKPVSTNDSPSHSTDSVDLQEQQQNITFTAYPLR